MMAFDSLLRLQMITLSILTTSSIHLSSKRLGEFQLGSERVAYVANVARKLLLNNDHTSGSDTTEESRVSPVVTPTLALLTGLFALGSE